MLFVLLLLLVITIIVCLSILRKKYFVENFSTQQDLENERQINRQINYCNSLLGSLQETDKLRISNI